MSKAVSKVFKFEFVRQIKKPAFWAATLLVPLLIGGIYLISFLSSQHVEKNPTLDENTKVAITDEAGIFAPETPYLISGDKDAGREMVKNGEIDLYYYIPVDFKESKKAEFYHISEGLELFNNDGNILKGLMVSDAASRVSELDALALTGGYEIVDHKLATNGEESNALGKAIIPFAIGIMFFMFVALCGNRFLLTVVEEKENRISEMILTSVSARHLIVGKIMAMLALGIVQVVALVTPVLLLVLLNHDNPVISGIVSTIVIDPVMIILSLLLFAVSVVFYAGTCVLVGSLVSTARDASSFIGPAIVAMVFPLYFMQMFMLAEPNFAVQFMTFFPFTAPIALMLRGGFGTISVAEYCIGILVVAVSAMIVVRFAVASFQKNAINFAIAKPKFWKK